MRHVVSLSPTYRWGDWGCYRSALGSTILAAPLSSSARSAAFVFWLETSLQSRPLGDEIRAARPRSTPEMASCHRSRLVMLCCLQLSRAATAKIVGITVSQIASPTDVPPSRDSFLCPTDAACQEEHWCCSTSDVTVILNIGITRRTLQICCPGHALDQLHQNLGEGWGPSISIFFNSQVS